jgi:RNA polymerase sigma-70 factor, ECF subfamily
MAEQQSQARREQECVSDSDLDVDWQLLSEGCQRQDPNAFTRLAAVTEHWLRRLLARLVHQHADCDDLVQETYLRAWRSARQFRGQSSLSTWLTRIAINVALNWRRDRQPTVYLLPEHHERLAALSSPDEHALANAYERALAELSPELRTTFVLHETERLSYNQIAELMECPIGTVMSRLHRARARLMASLSERAAEFMP